MIFPTYIRILPADTARYIYYFVNKAFHYIPMGFFDIMMPRIIAAAQYEALRA